MTDFWAKVWAEVRGQLKDGSFGADDDYAEEDDDHNDFFRYAPGPLFHRGVHPRHTRAIWLFVMRIGKR